MPTRTLGRGAPPVSAIGYGAMPLSIAGRPAEGESVHAIHAALEHGATIIDTADVYCLDDADLGHNERLIARALKAWGGARDERVIVATKGGLTRPEGRWERDGRPEHLRQACHRSLAALGVQQIDLYQLHAPDPRVPFAESVGALADLRAEGKIRWVGLSNVSVEEIDQARAIVPITTVQNRLSPFFREVIEPRRGLRSLLRPALSVLAHCAAHGIGFLAYSPVGGSRLNRKLPGHPVLAPIARRLGVSEHAVTLAWVLAQGSGVIPIPGGRTEDHVRDAMRAAAVALTQADLDSINAGHFSTA